MSKPTPFRMRLLLIALAAAALVAARVPDRLLSQWAFAVQRGQLEAVGEHLASVDQVSQAFRLVARKVRPGVVLIGVSGSEEELKRARERLEERLGGRVSDELWQEFLRRNPIGSGSGVILDERGHILTNNHVVENKTGITVTLDDGRELPAKLVGNDPKSDVAVIRIEAGDLHPLKLGDSDQMEVGDWVLAIGAPFGLARSVTHGIVSAKGRADVVLGREIMYRDFIQTDAAVNPGNSGGPLVNIRGEVIGINTAIATDDGGNAGINFAIPSNMAGRVARQLIESGAVARGWLGISLGELTRETARVLGLTSSDGVVVDLMYEGSPAERGGLACEDVVTEVNGKRVVSIRQFQTQIADVAPGEKAHLTVVRDGQPRTILLVVGRQPEDIQAFARRAVRITGRNVSELGVAARSLTIDLPLRVPREYVGRSGVLVVATGERAESNRFKLETGDLVVGANGASVATLADLTAALKRRAHDGATTLRVLTPTGEQREITVAAD